jgi:basic amino acid/polyamine antiporter, APA family
MSDTPARPAATDIAPAGMFIRDATGFVRQIGPWYALSLAVGAIAIGGGVIAFFFTLGVFPHANLYLSWLLGGAALVALGIVYVQLVETVPRTGGDYVFASRLLHPAVGASIGGALVVLFAIFPAFWATNFAAGHFAALTTALGDAFGSDTMKSWTFQSDNEHFALGAILIVLLTAIAMLSTVMGYRVLGWCFILGMLTLAVGLVVLATHSNGDFRAAFDKTYGAGSYQGVLDGAAKDGYSGGYTFKDTLGSLPYAALWMWGVAFAAYPGGELRNVGKTIKVSILGSAAVTIVVYLIATWIANGTLTPRFMAAANFLSLQHAEDYKVADSPSLTGYVGLLTSNGFAQVCIALIAIFTEIAIIMTYLLTTSRILFAFSFDRLLPDGLVKMSRRGTPVTAIAIISLTILVALAFSIYTDYLAILTNGTLGLAIVYVVISALPLLLIYRHRDLYLAGPRFLATPVAGVPLLVIISVVSVIFNFAIVILAMVHPLGLGPFTWKSALATIIFFSWGVVLWAGMRAMYRGRGQNLDAVLREIPSE